MSAFQHIIIKAITDYKALLKRNYDATICTAKFKNLGIKRKQLSSLDEDQLYEVMTKIIQDLEQQPQNQVKYQNYYSGTDEFLTHLRNIKADFRLENGRIIHVAQKAAWALVTAIQLAALPEHSLTDSIANKLHDCAKFIAKYGSPHQIHLFCTAINKHKPRHIAFFSKIQQVFEQHMQQTT
jgi:hypothetical protein